MWLMVFILAVSSLAVFEVAISVQLLTEQKVAPPCQAARLGASVASDGGFSGEMDAMVQLANLSPRVCALKGFPDLTAWTLAHRPLALAVSHFYGPKQSIGRYAFPAPRTLALHHGGAAYFGPRLGRRGRLPNEPRQPPAWTTSTSRSCCRANAVW